ncbi:hypothetical protein RRG08_000645 [Elysia crispata]|uniref:Uncharacterized protein n=1 Tax=Elysia crispata TaxID=231223 RepID=A0AAE0Y8E4_9GAST|nr:hypothetical protein RRG08_000645 [Elysia crispata]
MSKNGKRIPTAAGYLSMTPMATAVFPKLPCEPPSLPFTPPNLGNCPYINCSMEHLTGKLIGPLQSLFCSNQLHQSTGDSLRLSE